MAFSINLIQVTYFEVFCVGHVHCRSGVDVDSQTAFGRRSFGSIITYVDEVAMLFAAGKGPNAKAKSNQTIVRERDCIRERRK